MDPGTSGARTTGVPEILRRIEKEVTDGSLVGCLLESAPEHTCKPQKSSDPRKRENNRETSVCVLVR